ncbi:MFS transporter [Candidatus Woesebacteria bacterium]|nr:MFS transporter [Candidatus Woesebacteria bacterium]
MIDTPAAHSWSKWPRLKEVLGLNKILYVLIASDFIILSAYGFLSPVFAIFLTDRIIGGTLIVVGISEAIYLATKSIFQIPFSILIDKTEGERIDFWFLFAGSVIMSGSLFLYLFVSLPWHIYLISLIYGLGNALADSSWSGLFTRNIIRDRESFAWSFSSTVVDLGEAGAAVIGAIIAQFLGFDKLFVIVGSVSLVGTFLLFLFYRELRGIQKEKDIKNS